MNSRADHNFCSLIVISHAVVRLSGSGLFVLRPEVFHADCKYGHLFSKDFYQGSGN